LFDKFIFQFKDICFRFYKTSVDFKQSFRFA
jgi:hypothetical protein